MLSFEQHKRLDFVEVYEKLMQMKDIDVIKDYEIL